MPATTRSPRSRPHSAPAYYLTQPASVWISPCTADRKPTRSGWQAAGSPGRGTIYML